MPIAPQDGNVSLRQKIAQIDDGFDVAGEESGSRNRLPEKEIQRMDPRVPPTR